MEQRRSLPRQSVAPYVAELTPLELAIVRHAAVVVLYRSPLRDQMDLDEILEMVEAKKQGFWGKLFKGNDKKNIKKKGTLLSVPRLANGGLNGLKASLGYRWSCLSSARVQTRYMAHQGPHSQCRASLMT